MTEDMEQVKGRIYTVKCPQCGTVYGLHPDNLSEEELEKGAVTCPKCGSLITFKNE